MTFTFLGSMSLSVGAVTAFIPASSVDIITAIDMNLVGAHSWLNCATVISCKRSAFTTICFLPSC